MYNRTEAKKMYAEDPTVEIYYNAHKGKGWRKCVYPQWHSENEYRVVPSEYAEAWQAYLDGELVILVGGSWEKYKESGEAPRFILSPDHYKRSRWSIFRERAKTRGAVVYEDAGDWVAVSKPLWSEDGQYVVILPERAESWQAYLDGELEVYLQYSLQSRHKGIRPREQGDWSHLCRK